MFSFIWFRVVFASFSHCFTSFQCALAAMLLLNVLPNSFCHSLPILNHHFQWICLQHWHQNNKETNNPTTKKKREKKKRETLNKKPTKFNVDCSVFSSCEWVCAILRSHSIFNWTKTSDRKWEHMYQVCAMCGRAVTFFIFRCKITKAKMGEHIYSP